MKKYLAYIFLLLVCAACQKEENLGEGNLTVALHVKSELQKAQLTRALVDDRSKLDDKAVIRIRNSRNQLLREYRSLANMPNVIHLISGQYKIEAYTGDRMAVSEQLPFYEGKADFTISKGENTNVELPLYVKNTVVKVAFSEAAMQKYSSATVKISSKAGEISFDKAHLDKTGYFILGEGETSLKWNITATTAEGVEYSKEGEAKNIKPSTIYTFNFDYSDAEFNKGGGVIAPVIEVEPIEPRVEDMVVNMPPKIEIQEKGLLYPLAPKNFALNEKADKVEISVRTSSRLKSLELSSSAFIDKFSLGQSVVDLQSMAENTKEQLLSKGLKYVNEYDPELKVTSAKITFGEEFMGVLTSGSEATYRFEIKAEDDNHIVKKGTLEFIVSNAVVRTIEFKQTDIWATRAELKANVNTKLLASLEPGEKELAIQYRKEGEQVWQKKVYNGGGETMDVKIDNLTPNTRYEYRAYCKGQTQDARTYTFTTEAAGQLPNSGFEEHYLSGAALFFNQEGGIPFWGTGNPGSATMNKNVTTFDSSVKAPQTSGSGSLKMKSQFVGVGIVGKFAAGNIFSGTYVRTDGTDGVLNFGRPFKSRPAKLRGYLKYIPQNITKRGDKSPADAPQVGQMDKGYIYIALGDWAVDEDATSESPITIKTAVPKLFDKNSKSIIAYGEKVLESATEGEAMIPFEIPLDYRDLNRLPKYIVVVATSSKYGDYFTGGEGSTLWLDDLELVYE